MNSQSSTRRRNCVGFIRTSSRQQKFQWVKTNCLRTLEVTRRFYNSLGIKTLAKFKLHQEYRRSRLMVSIIKSVLARQERSSHLVDFGDDQREWLHIKAAQMSQQIHKKSFQVRKSREVVKINLMSRQIKIKIKNS